MSVLKDLDPARVRPYVTITKDGLERAIVAVELLPGLAGVAVVETTPAEVLLKGAHKAN